MFPVWFLFSISETVQLLYRDPFLLIQIFLQILIYFYTEYSNKWRMWSLSMWSRLKILTMLIWRVVKYGMKCVSSKTDSISRDKYKDKYMQVENTYKSKTWTVTTWSSTWSSQKFYTVIISWFIPLASSLATDDKFSLEMQWDIYSFQTKNRNHRFLRERFTSKILWKKWVRKMLAKII